MKAARPRRTPRSRRVFRGMAFGVLMAVWGCPPPDPPAEEMPEDGERLDPTPDVQNLSDNEPRAELIDRNGDAVGSISFVRADREGVRVHGTLHAPELAGGDRGFHVHEEGACLPPGFESAGDHFDPHGTPHGGRDDPPDQRHAGDLGNVAFDEAGRAQIDFIDRVISVEGGVEDIRGRSVVVHEEEDDLVTQPSGDAGDPWACGVIES